MPGEDEDIYPVLSDRHNIVVIADEAHRTQYGFEASGVSLQDSAFSWFFSANSASNAVWVCGMNPEPTTG